MGNDVSYRFNRWARAFTLLLLFMSSATFLSVSGQIKLSLQQTTVGEVLKSIKAQTDYNFFYEDRIAAMPVESIEVDDKSLDETLQVLFKDLDITYKVEENIVYLSSKEAASAPAAGRPEATQGKSVSGQVIDVNGEPLIGVSILVKGTTDGTITDFDGNYTLSAADGAQLEFSYMGYQTQTLDVTGSVMNVTLLEDAQLIEEVVVTALGIKREKKMLGYAVQDIKSDKLNSTGDPSVTGALQGKVAGLQMNTSSTGLGGSTKITIRGNSSLTDNNQPLWIVDGVPFSDINTSSASGFSGIDRGGTSLDINPDDIESISVLKGPNAAALYGSRAGNGVILVTTKKGTKKDGFGVSYNGNFTWNEVSNIIPTQTKYGQGNDGVYNSTSQDSFGPALDGSDQVAWNGQTYPYKRYGEKQRDYFNTGFSQNHSVSVGGMTDTSDFRASFGYNDNKGLFNGESLNKITADLKAGMQMNKYLSMDAKLSMSRVRAENRPVTGFYGEMAQLLKVPNNVRLDDLKNFSTSDNMHHNWTTVSMDNQNPYYVNHRYQNSDERWRAFGYYGLNLNLAKWLKFRAKYAFDYHRTRVESTDLGNEPGVTDINKLKQDNMSKGEENFFEQNIEALFIGDTPIGEKFHLGYSLGGNIMYQKFENLTVGVTDFYQKDSWMFMEAKKLNSAFHELREKAVYSVFATAQLSYDNYLALDLTARNDWSSTLPRPHSYFYPSANLSFVVTDFVRSLNALPPSWLTFAKVRLSAAQVGKDTDPYQLYNTIAYKYENGQSVLNPPARKIQLNDNLKPEIATSYEAGLDMKFLDNRLGFDFTYYHSRTKNQIMEVPAAAPYHAKLINAGLITNQGVEFMLYSTIVDRKDFTFNLDLNIAHNVTTVNELHKDVDYMMFNGDANFPLEVGARKGGRLGEIYARRLIQRDANGQAIIDPTTGLPRGTEDLQTRLDNPIGCIQPDLLMSVTPSFRYKGFSLSALFDMQFGGNIVSVSEGIMTNYGVSALTERRGEMILPGVTPDGQTNTTPCDAEDYYKFIGVNKSSGFAEEFVYDASYIRLKEVSLSYSFPKRWLEKTPLSTLRLSVVGRNLAYLMKHTPGNATGGYDTSMFSQALDFTSVPATRTFGFSVNIDF